MTSERRVARLFPKISDEAQGALILISSLLIIVLPFVMMATLEGGECLRSVRKHYHYDGGVRPTLRTEMDAYGDITSIVTTVIDPAVDYDYNECVEETPRYLVMDWMWDHMTAIATWPKGGE